MKQATLDLIGRHHTVDMVKEKFRMARDLGFDNINMDLIIGLPEEDIDDVRSTMEQVRELAPDSVTVHSLAIKRAARLNIFKEQLRELKDPEHSGDDRSHRRSTPARWVLSRITCTVRKIWPEISRMSAMRHPEKHVSTTSHYGGKANHRGLRCRNHHESHVPGGKPSGTRGECKGCSFLYREDRRDDR